MIQETVRRVDSTYIEQQSTVFLFSYADHPGTAYAGHL